MDEHYGAHHSYSGGNRPRPLRRQLVMVKRVLPVNLQTLWGDGGDAALPLGGVPGTQAKKNLPPLLTLGTASKGV